MARRCICADILALLDHANVRALPLTTRAVLIDVLRQIAASPTPGTIRFLRPVAESVAVWLSIAVTEAETELGRLVELGFVVVGADGKSLTSPRIKSAADRSEINRINGLKGGRPPKDRTPGQREIMLPIAGGKTEITKTDPQSVSTASSSLKIANKKKEEAEEPRAWVDLGLELAATIGLERAHGFINCRPVETWLGMGLEPGQIRAVVAELAARGRHIAGLAYFTPAMRDLAQQAKVAAPTARSISAREFNETFERWNRGGRVGPAPVWEHAA